jgi:hypothetical protein
MCPQLVKDLFGLKIANWDVFCPTTQLSTYSFFLRRFKTDKAHTNLIFALRLLLCTFLFLATYQITLLSHTGHSIFINKKVYLNKLYQLSIFVF